MKKSISFPPAPKHAKKCTRHLCQTLSKVLTNLYKAPESNPFPKVCHFRRWNKAKTKTTPFPKQCQIRTFLSETQRLVTLFQSFLCLGLFQGPQVLAAWSFSKAIKALCHQCTQPPLAQNLWRLPLLASTVARQQCKCLFTPGCFSMAANLLPTCAWPSSGPLHLDRLGPPSTCCSHMAAHGHQPPPAHGHPFPKSCANQLQPALLWGFQCDCIWLWHHIACGLFQSLLFFLALLWHHHLFHKRGWCQCGALWLWRRAAWCLFQTLPCHAEAFSKAFSDLLLLSGSAEAFSKAFFALLEACSSFSWPPRTVFTENRDFSHPIYHRSKIQTGT